MLDTEKVKDCYYEWKKNYDHFLKIDRDYNCGNMKRTLPQVNSALKTVQRDVEVNFVQKLDDEESNYSFNNKVTFSALDKQHKSAVEWLNNYWKILGNPESSNGKKLVQFHELYEINFIGKDKTPKQHIVTPLEGNIYINHLGEYEFFILVHNKVIYDEHNKGKVVDYVDVYDEENIYYLDNNFNLLETEPHLMGEFPVGVAIVDEQKYTTRNGYRQGTKTNHDKIHSLQEAFQSNLSDMSEEITNFHNAILVGKNIAQQPLLDDDGNVVVDKQGNPILKPPVLSSDSLVMLDCDSDTPVSLEWLIKNVNDTFIKNTRDDIKKLIYEMSSHINSNEELVSNISGIALRSRLQNLESKCKANEQAMECIVRKRISCLFNYLKAKQKADWDVNSIEITFTPCIPQDITTLGDFISKVPQDVMSNETKMTIIPYINNVELEKERIKQEKLEDEPKVDLDKETGDTDEEVNE